MSKFQSLIMMLALSLGWLTAFAQSPTVSPELLEMFRSLSPEQQQQILEQMTEGQKPAQSTGKPAVPGEAADPVSADRPPEDMLVSPEVETRLLAGAQFLLSIQLRELPEGAEPRGFTYQLALEQFAAQVLKANPHQLNRAGNLGLPGLRPIQLAGLSVEQAQARLEMEAALKEYEIEISMLPIEPELKPFGYDLFSSVPTRFAPATDMPVPANYVVGPGDVIEVQLIGERGGRYSLPVSRDGTVDFPQLGPIPIAGMRFEDARALLESRVQEQMIGMRASVSIGELRTIQVFVLGDAVRPGSYSVGGLSTITNALFSSGGVKPIGSLRNIQLKRNGQIVTRLDFYDLLLNGDTSKDLRLLPGDVIFIPPVGATVGITGEVRRPAIYEITEGTSSAEILGLAGGLTPEADPRLARLARIDDRRNYTVLNLDLTTPQGRDVRLQTGDLVRVLAVRDSVENAVVLEGQVHRPGRVGYRPGMRITDVISSLDELRPLADLNYLLIQRESGPDRRVSVVSVDLEAALANRGSHFDLLLQPRDTIYVFDLASSRDLVTGPIIETLRRQSSAQSPTRVVSIGGRVKTPGRFPLEPGMRISDLIRAGGGLDEAAYASDAELTRYTIENGEQRETDLVPIDLARLLSGDATADVELKPFDYVVIKEVPDWGEQEIVTLSGEVRFPGSYPIQRGESLRSVLKRAGGLTNQAFPEGGVFTRRELQQREERQLKLLADNLQRDLATLALQSSQTTPAAAQQASEAVAVGQSLLSQLRSTKGVGRFVVDLPRLMAAGGSDATDLTLRDGDRLMIPKQSQEVTVLGEVPNTTSHLYEPGLTLQEYVNRSGGVTRKGDAKGIYVVHANGSVATRGRGGWFSRGGNIEIRPGDTIVVPLDAERMRPLPLWTAVTTIIYNLAIAVAAVGSL